MLTLVVLVVLVAAGMLLLAHFLGREDKDVSPPTVMEEEGTVPEQTGLGDPEWKIVIRGQCEPLNCPNFKGNPRRPGKEPGCQVCAALFLEQYGKRLIKSQREGRNR